MITMLGLGATAAAAPFQGTVEYRVDVSGDRASLLLVMLPTSMTLEVGKKTTAIELRGGAAPSGRFLVDTETGVAQFLSDLTQTVATVAPVPVPPTTVEELRASEEILGYECRKHLVIRQTPTGAQRGWVWTMESAEAPPTASLAGLPNPLMLPTTGVPLRILLDDAGAVMTIEAVSVDLRPPKKNRLTIPAGWGDGTFP
jgi:hypothetical protein